MKKINQFAQWLGFDNAMQLIIAPPLFWACLYFGWALAAALEAVPV